MNASRLLLYRASDIWPGAIVVAGLICGILSFAVSGPSDPPSPESDGWYVKGNQLAAANHIDEAIEAFETAQSLDPRKADTYFALGTMWLQKQDWLRAETSFDRFVKLRPTSAQAWTLLARCRLSRGDTQGAKSAYVVALGLDSSDQEAKAALDRLTPK